MNCMCAKVKDRLILAFIAAALVVLSGASSSYAVFGWEQGGKLFRGECDDRF